MERGGETSTMGKISNKAGKRNKVGGVSVGPDLLDKKIVRTCSIGRETLLKE